MQTFSNFTLSILPFACNNEKVSLTFLMAFNNKVIKKLSKKEISKKKKEIKAKKKIAKLDKKDILKKEQKKKFKENRKVVNIDKSPDVKNTDICLAISEGLKEPIDLISRKQQGSWSSKYISQLSSNFAITNLFDLLVRDEINIEISSRNFFLSSTFDEVEILI